MNKLFQKSMSFLICLNFLIFFTTPVFAYRIYRVQPEDTVFQIATWYGLSAQQLAEINRLPNKTHIIPRQALLIPEPVTLADEELYTVKTGDTVENIAKRYGISRNWLLERNKLTNSSSIFSGQMLKVPKQLANSVSILTKPVSLGESGQSKYYWNIPDLIKRSPGNVLLKGTVNQRKIALTYDDGPDSRFTTAILDLLGALNVKATFFLKGKNIPGQEWVVTRMQREGHLIANHSYTHPNLRKLQLPQLQEEILETEKTIAKIVHKDTAMIRPPYGEMSEEGLDWLVTEGYRMIHWSVDSGDWQAKHADEVLINTLPQINPGSIILMHSAGGEGQDLTPTVKATEDLIYTLWGLGFEIVPLTELLEINAYQ